MFDVTNVNFVDKTGMHWFDPDVTETGIGQQITLDGSDNITAILVDIRNLQPVEDVGNPCDGSEAFLWPRQRSHLQLRRRRYSQWIGKGDLHYARARARYLRTAGHRPPGSGGVAPPVAALTRDFSQ